MLLKRLLGSCNTLRHNLLYQIGDLTWVLRRLHAIGQRRLQLVQRLVDALQAFLVTVRSLLESRYFLLEVTRLLLDYFTEQCEVVFEHVQFCDGRGDACDTSLALLSSLLAFYFIHF